MSQQAKARCRRPAATVVILRDGPDGIEVFMVVRHHEIDFASGALVFPGGKVDEQDADPAWADFAPGSRRPTGSPTSSRRRARPSRRRAWCSRDRVMPIRCCRPTTHIGWSNSSRASRRGRVTFIDLVRSQDLLIATELMVPFAHWITPEGQPKRFDTHFLLISAPVEQLGAHDGTELVEGLWITPRQALGEAQAGTKTLLFPTEMNLRKLAGHRTVAEAIEATRATPSLPSCQGWSAPPAAARCTSRQRPATASRSTSCQCRRRRGSGQKRSTRSQVSEMQMR